MSFKRKQISETSWMIFEDSKPFGFLREENGLLKLMVGSESFEFASHDEMTAQFGRIIDIENQTKEVKEINGYPARHAGAIAVEHEKYPVYNVGGNVLFVAGYFALKFTNSNYQVVHGPKLSTIEANDIIGPFKSRLEALREVNIHNRRLENDKELHAG